MSRSEAFRSAHELARSFLDVDVLEDETADVVADDDEFVALARARKQLGNVDETMADESRPERRGEVQSRQYDVDKLALIRLNELADEHGIEERGPCSLVGGFQ